MEVPLFPLERLACLRDQIDRTGLSSVGESGPTHSVYLRRPRSVICMEMSDIEGLNA